MKNLFKKAASLGLCGVIMMSALCVNAQAADVITGVALKGIYEAYNTIGIGDLKGKDLTGTYTVEWYASDTKTGTYSSVGTDNTYAVKAADAGKWLKASVTTADGTFETLPEQIRAIETPVALDGTAGNQIGTNEKTPAQYKFTVDGKEFILLDVTDDDDSKFFVMSNNHVGVSRYSRFYMYSNDPGYSAAGNSANAEVATTAIDMAAFLNDKDSVNVIIGDAAPQSYNGAWKYGTTGEISGTYAYGTSPVYGYSQQTKNWKLLPTDIKNHINYDRYWVCEPHSFVFGGEVFAIQGGIMLPSYSEVKRYADRIGLWEEYNVSTTATKLSTCWWTRTPASGASPYAVDFGALGKIAGRGGHTNGNAGCSVRPVFYLDRDFFLEVELDPATTGEEVKKAIREVYSKSEMYADGQYTKLQLERDWGYGSDLAAEAEYTLSSETLTVDTTISCEMGSYTDFIILCTVFNADGQLIGADAQKKSITEGESLAADDFVFSGITGVQTVNISLIDSTGFWPLIKQTAAELQVPGVQQ